MVTMLFAYARRARKSLFQCSSTHQKTEVMAICLRDNEMVVRNQSLFVDRLCL